MGSHIENMIRGVTKGYKFKMRFAYAHFPIQANVTNNDTVIEVKNFIGEKYTRTIQALEGVKILRTEEQKDLLTLEGTSLENVSLTFSLIQNSTSVKNKDTIQFLDGIYVSEKRLAMKE